MSDRQPRHKQSGEPSLWYTRFKSYLLAGPSRSIHGTWRREKADKLKKKPGDVTGYLPGSWRTTSQNWNWADRAHVLDFHQLEIEEQKWNERRTQIRELEFDTSVKLLNTALRILDSIEIQADTSPQVVARIADIGSKLGRLSTGLGTPGADPSTDELSALIDELVSTQEAI